MGGYRNILDFQKSDPTYLQRSPPQTEWAKKWPLYGAKMKKNIKEWTNLILLWNEPTSFF